MTFARPVSPMTANPRNLNRVLDISVATFVLLAFLFFTALAAVSFFPGVSRAGLERLFESLTQRVPVLPILAAVTCLLLAAWISIGNGSESKLWKWLPPFVFFQKFGKLGRVMLVWLLILGTILGLLGELFGVVPPM